MYLGHKSLSSDALQTVGNNQYLIDYTTRLRLHVTVRWNIKSYFLNINHDILHDLINDAILRQSRHK